MEFQSACAFLQNHPRSTQFYPQLHPVSKLKKQRSSFQIEFKSFWPHLKRRGVVICGADLNSSRKLGFRVNASKNSEPFRGKSGSVSFVNITHQSVEESQLVSTPFKENTGSLLWVLAPIALISSLIVPQFFIVNAIEDFIKNEVLAEIVSSFSTEVVFYAGLAIFLLVTDHVQKPFLQFSPKRWSLITGLRGYLTSAFFTMGFKIFAPLLAVYVTWPVLGLPALVSVLPFLFGCLAQYLFERRLDMKGSSCWPLVPIIFEVYRIYQLTRATSFMEKLMFAMRGASVTPTVLDRTGALVSMITTFRVLGLVCLWSLLTFLLRLFPSRPVAENY
ncbi:unnamed protein product [Fraxinus pennsylvanica]|uniref:Uncharacterized protein n=1 Tax=Fraxinus pennsylvanica TaxID=56036 RepID=A0AAD2E7V3_9LAMI|nr:unnamed protein product [Fraxinus pennsylvanica]